MSQDLFKNLGVNVAQLVNTNIGPSLLPMVITMRTFGDRDQQNPAGGRTSAEITRTARGFIGRLSTYEIANRSRAREGDVRLEVLGDSIQGGVPPDENDFITVEGKRYQILELMRRDPASAKYTYLARGNG